MIWDDFMIRAALAGAGVSLAAAPLGCFVMWRRMAYFSDAMAHAAVLGVALSLAFSVSVFTGVLAVAVLMALIVTTLHARGLEIDTTLGVLAHSALAAGLVAVSLLQNAQIDLMAYLFGDILAVDLRDLLTIWAGALGAVALLCWRWNALLTTTLHPDLACASNISPKVEQLYLTLALALVVAVAMKIVGALLIGALIIIPAATARSFARTPEFMAILAVCLASGATLGGLQLSLSFDTPTGPTIVCLAAVLFALSRLIRSTPV